MIQGGNGNMLTLVPNFYFSTREITVCSKQKSIQEVEKNRFFRRNDLSRQCVDIHYNFTDEKY